MERPQWLAALTALVVLLFVSGGLPQARPWRRQLRKAAIVMFWLAVAAVIGEIAVWLAGG
jgi:hypothetical protein